MPILATPYTVYGVNDHSDLARRRRIDAGIAVGVAVVLVLLTAIATEDVAREPDLAAYALAAAIGFCLYWRRAFPVGVAVVSLTVLFVYHALGYPAIGNIPLVVALASAAYHGAILAAVGVAITAMGGSLAWFVYGEGRGLPEAINIAVGDSGVLAAVILLGSVLRSRRLLAEQTRESLRLARLDEEARASKRISEERMEIAREIHDVVAHTVTLIGVQAQVAIDALDDNLEATRSALTIIKDSTRDATAELRATIGVLRSTPSRHPAPGLDQLDDLLESASSSGLTVDVSISGRERGLSSLVQLVAYRVIQEAMTNVVKHARASLVRIGLHYHPTVFEVTVSDDGVGCDTGSGHGLAGMRERVEAIGGSLELGSSEFGGLELVARLPAGTKP